MEKFVPIVGETKAPADAITAHVSLTGERLVRVQRARARYNLSMNLFVRQCIDFALAHMEEEKPS